MNLVIAPAQLISGIRGARLPLDLAVPRRRPQHKAEIDQRNHDRDDPDDGARIHAYGFTRAGRP